MSKKVFVLGATGLQGAAISKSILLNGHTIHTLSSNANPEVLLEGILSYPGDLGDKSAIVKALENVDVAVYTFPLIFDMDKALSYTQNFIDTAKRQKVPFIIFNSSFDVPESKTNFLGVDIKYEIQRQFEASSLNVLTLMPDIYLNNLAAPWSIPLVIEKSILPYPIESGKKVPWVSHQDLARFVASAVEKPELAGQKLSIGGTVLSGEEIAASISEYLGQEITFISLKPDDFEKQLIPAFGELNAKEISNLYRYVAQKREGLINKPFSSAQELLGVQPTPTNEWVESVNWSVSPSYS